MEQTNYPTCKLENNDEVRRAFMDAYEALVRLGDTALANGLTAPFIYSYPAAISCLDLALKDAGLAPVWEEGHVKRIEQDKSEGSHMSLWQLGSILDAANVVRRHMSMKD